MKAITYHQYGTPTVLRLEDVPMPVTKAGDVRVRVHAAAVTTADWRLRASEFPGGLWIVGRLMVGLFAPRNRVLGVAFSGVVDAVGDDVKRFSPGDAVFGFSGGGAHADYVTVSQDGAIASKPDNMEHEEAAAVPFGALSALVFLRDFAKVQAGQRVLIVGASGGVGSYAVQLARHLGAQVTGVCSADNAAMVRGLGAEKVIDYQRDPIWATGGGFDVVLDTVGVTNLAQARKALTPTGVFVPLNFGFKEVAQALLARFQGGVRMALGVSGDRQDDLELLADLMKDGTLQPVVDSIWPFESAQAAHARVESRHSRGTVVLAGAGIPVKTVPAALLKAG